MQLPMWFSLRPTCLGEFEVNPPPLHQVHQGQETGICDVVVPLESRT